ncbi:family 1 glycosylhydrolase [Clostridium sp. Sa3CUN1]|uniref:Family 1 glycosylhydrolase n=1 Tax=Clostridium gallinarum TaxID=2762246 RepID=A0ABR8Q095_9CLOT|nr:family 1 glycosylhydrolase [Clostridium gallinarum]
MVWTLIFPLDYESKPNKVGLQFYKNIFKECPKYGIKPILVTANFIFLL